MHEFSIIFLDFSGSSISFRMWPYIKFNLKLTMSEAIDDL